MHIATYPSVPASLTEHDSIIEHTRIKRRHTICRIRTNQSQCIVYLRISVFLSLLRFQSGFLPYGATSFVATRKVLKVIQQQDSTFDTTYDGDGSLTAQTFHERYNSSLPLWLLTRCDECGWTYPTRIQEKVLDAVLIDECTDIIVQSETGSGKTLSYLLPCFSSIDSSRSAVQALIVVPTRELGLQVSRVAKRLAASSILSDKIMIMSILQGSQNRRQRAWAWAEPPHVIIGTPEELCLLIRNGGIKRCNSIKYLVVDEVDACLLNNIGKISTTSQFTGTPLHDLLSKYLSPTYDDGRELIAMESDTAAVTVSPNQQQQRPILKSRRTIFCSATIPQHRYFAKQCIQNQWVLQTPTYISLQTGSQRLPSQLKHGYMIVSEAEKKLAALRRTLKKIMLSCIETNEPKRILIFTDTNRPLEEMAKVISTDINGFYYNEQSISSTKILSSNNNYPALISVLRYEDSLSQRAVAMDALRGSSDNGSSSSRRRNSLHSNNDHVPSTMIDLHSSQILLRIMLSTDLAARGIDIVDITHVIHMDLPDSVDIYVHRSGRTGRLGRHGQILSIITQEQEFVLQRIANTLQVDMTYIGRQTQQES